MQFSKIPLNIVKDEVEYVQFGSLIREGKKDEALTVLLEEEGHWLSKEDAQKAIDFLNQEMGPKTSEELFNLFQEKPDKHFTVKELRQALTHAIEQLKSR